MTTSPRTLSESEFGATFIPPMNDVTNNAEEVIDLWGYAEPALRQEFPEVCSCDWNVKHIYESSNGAFQHVLIPTHKSNLYLVVVIDKLLRQVLGHHMLDLGEKYGVAR
ncbi:MAG: hypothetical protein IV112_18675 [Methyloversatilis discipulorum]|uniref:hypothetical protein n=1 Tax=Methyloversatilis discipulorum TaxID=1119528 RepID=UPI0026EFE585|nr:hypothetical protein [Methyloversatilis discipulorum]MBT9518714.1 hypothetical protein [Methyloversatilis discipulorum]